MRDYRLLAAAVFSSALLLTTSCNESSKYVPVSGVVKLNGKPYPGAVVSFQPEGSRDDPNPGRGSYGVTDANGRFSLASDDGNKGAVVGSHQIKIRTQGEVVGYDPKVGSSDNAPAPNKGKVDPIPNEWRNIGNKTFTVPAGGTDQANFDIDNTGVKK